MSVRACRGDVSPASASSIDRNVLPPHPTELRRERSRSARTHLRSREASVGSCPGRSTNPESAPAESLCPDAHRQHALWDQDLDGCSRRAGDSFAVSATTQRPFRAAFSHSLREASWSGLVPSGRRSAAICQKKTPRNPCFMAHSVLSATDSASS